MERQLFNPIVLSLIIVADCIAIYDLLRHGKERGVLYKVVMICLILLLPLLGVSIYYATRNRHRRKGKLRSVLHIELSAILLSIIVSCNKEVDVEWVETIHRVDNEREFVINDKEDIQRIRENLLGLKSESYIAFFDLLIEEQYTDPVKTAENIRSDKTLSMLDKMILIELIDYTANSVELRSSSDCEWKRKKRIVALAAKCTWDICTGRDADDIVKDATEDLKNIREEYKKCHENL